MLRRFLFLSLLLTSTLSADEPKSMLAKEMAGFGDLFKLLRDEQDATKGADLARKAQLHLINSLQYAPAVLSEMPAGPERTRAEATYRRMIAQTLVLLCQTEEAYLAGDLKMVARLRGIINKLKESGHDEFVDE